MPATLPRTTALVHDGIDRGLHRGVQLYVSQEGAPVADLGIGEARDGEPMTPEHLTLWLSSTKPTAAVALGVLWERGELLLDDPIARYIPEFAEGGKEAVTLRQTLTHTSGFRMLSVGWPKASWEEIVAKISAQKLEPRWVPGEKAGYHMSSSWFILGEVIRRIDGRPYDRFVREEVFEPLGMDDSWVGMPEERFEEYGDRIAVMFNTEVEPGGLVPAEHGWHKVHHVTASSPGGNGRGPMRELGRFYESLLGTTQGWWTGESVVTPQTVEALTARHRVGLLDNTFRAKMDWGLGFIINSAHYEQEHLPYAYGPHASRNTWGHSGYRSSTAFADPKHRLVVALATNGTPREEDHMARMSALTGSIYEELGLEPSPGEQ